MFISVFLTSISAADLPSNGCLLEAKYLYDECIKRRNTSAVKWDSAGSIENGCQLEVTKIKDQCLKQYNYQKGEYQVTAVSDISPNIPILIPSSATLNSNTSRNAQNCSFKSLLERIYQRTKTSKEQISIRQSYLTNLENQNFSESILSLNKIEEKIITLDENYIPLKNSYETSTTPQVDNFIKILGYGSNKNIADPSITMTIDELVQLNLNERKNADDFILQIETIKTPLENLFVLIQAEIDARELLEKNKAKSTENFSNTLKDNTLKTINLADNFNVLLKNDTPTFSGTQAITLYPISEDDVSEMVKNLHLLALVSGKAMHLLSERNQALVAPSFSLSVSTDALYLAEEVKFRSDYVSNIIDFDECAKCNDLANPDNQQESHLIRSLLLSMQASILAARFSESRETLLEMNAWNHLFTDQEKNIRETKIRIFTELLKTSNMLKNVASLKMEHARAWKKLTDLIEIRTQTCVGVISPTPIPIATPTINPIANCPANANSILLEAQAQQKVVDSYQATAKDQLTFFATSEAKIKAQLSDAQSFGNVKIQASAISDLPSNSTLSIALKYIRKLKLNVIKTFFSLNSALAAKVSSEPLDLALGITDGSRYHSFFDLTKQTHKSIMLGQSKSYPDYEMSDLLKRSNYLSFNSSFSLSAYQDMAKRTYTQMISNSEKNTEILAAISHDSFKGFSTDMENQYQKTLQLLMPKIALVSQSLKSNASPLSTKSYFSSQTANILRDKRNTEIGKINLPTKKIYENKFYERNYYNDQNIQLVSNQISAMTLDIVDNLNKYKSNISIQELDLFNKIKNQPTLLKPSSLNNLANAITNDTLKTPPKLIAKNNKVKELQFKTPVVPLGDITPSKIINTLKDTLNTEKIIPTRPKDNDIYYKTQGQNTRTVYEKNDSSRLSPSPSLWEIISNTYMKVAYPQLIDETQSP